MATSRTVLALGLLGAALAASALGLAAPASPGCPPIPRGEEPVQLRQTQFVNQIANRYWPMRPGSRWVYRETDVDGSVTRVVVTVASKTKTIVGVRATAVRDVATEDGKVVEATWDWYAQDRCGNVWYLGEATKAYAVGKPPSTEGSWQAGVQGAQPGVVVLAKPRLGARYRQEYLEGEAEDRGEVIGVDEQVEVPYGHFTHALLTRETTPHEPRVVEYKLYAPGIGPVLALDISGGSAREELVSFRRGR